MSSETMFWYKRYERVPARDEKNQPTGGIVIVEAEDCFNLYEVIRGHWKDGGTFLVWLKDGHEESIEKEYPDQVKAQMLRQGKDLPKERRYLLSQIELMGEDVRRFKLASELVLHRIPEVDLPNVIAPHALNLPKSPVAEVTMTSAPTNTGPIPSMKVVKEEKEEVLTEETKLPEKIHDIDLLPEETAVVENNNDDNDIAVV